MRLLVAAVAVVLLVAGCDSRIAEYRKRVGPWNGSDSAILESSVIRDCVQPLAVTGTGLNFAIVRDRGIDIDPQEADAFVRALTQDILGLGHAVVYKDKADWILDIRIQATSGPPPKLDFGYDVEVWFIDAHDGTKSFALTTEVKKDRF